jgi:hypothetical protein
MNTTGSVRGVCTHEFMRCKSNVRWHGDAVSRRGPKGPHPPKPDGLGPRCTSFLREPLRTNSCSFNTPPYVDVAAAAAAVFFFFWVFFG